MIRFIRPLVVVTSFALLASPALAQSRGTRDAVERAAGTLDPNIPARQQGRNANGRWGQPSSSEGNGRWGRGRSSTANGTYGSGTYDNGSARRHDDDDDRDQDDDGNGPGRNGRGHAYGHYKNKHQNQGNYGNSCLDDNRNGICDDAERNGGYHGGYDNGGYNGGYDNGAYSNYPSSLPDMIGAVMGSRGQLSADASRWLGNGSYSARTMRARNGRIAQAAWYDRSGSMVQRWVDRNLDGRADLVQIFRNGQLVRTVTR